MKRPPKQLRLDEDLEREVAKIAEITSLPDVEVIRQMVRAGVRAVKQNNYRLTLPMDLRVVEHSPGERDPAQAVGDETPARAGEVIEPGPATVPRRKKKTVGLSREQQQ